MCVCIISKNYITNYVSASYILKIEYWHLKSFPLPHRHLFCFLLSYSHDVNASGYYNAEFTALIANLKLDEFVQSRNAQMDTM